MLLSILVLSLIFSSYVEGLEPIAVVNADAPKSDMIKSDSNTIPNDAIVLGKPSNKLLTVADIKNTLTNDKGVQQLLTTLPVKK